MIYPLAVLEAAKRQEGESEAEALARLDGQLSELLEVVRLSYLLEREGGWGAVTEWGEKLSLGKLKFTLLQ